LGTIAHGFHWKRLGRIIAFPAWFLIGWRLIEALHTLGYIGDHVKWLTTPKGNLFVIFFGLAWLFAVGLWPSRSETKREHKDVNEKPVDRQREAQLKLAPLMRWENDLDGQLASAHVLAELLEVHCESKEWIKQIIALLKEANYETDAEVILQADSAPPSADQIASFEAWKRYEVARLSLCRETLAQIREKRRL
jgi:hypothetical protein